jgi:hypothetical protein
LLELLHLDLLGLDVLLLLVELLLEPAQLVLEVLVALDQPVGPFLPPLLFGLRLGSYCVRVRRECVARVRKKCKPERGRK